MNIFNVYMFMQYGVRRLLSSSSIINADSEVQIHNVTVFLQRSSSGRSLYYMTLAGWDSILRHIPPFSPAIQWFIKGTAWRELTGLESGTNLLISL
jgi:hypothetical protein